MPVLFFPKDKIRTKIDSREDEKGGHSRIILD